MPKIEKRVGERLSRGERLAVVIAILASVGVHLVAFTGFGGFSLFAEKEKKRERLMVIRRVRDTAPAPLDLPPPVAVPIRPPEPAKVPQPPSQDAGGGRKAGEEGESGSRAGDPAKAPELSESMVQEAQEAPAAAVTAKLTTAPGPSANNAVTVVTDLAAATFLVSGPVENWGSGTYWLRKGLPPGEYSVTFQPAPGLVAPARQTKTLVDGGQIVFVGKYTRNVEVVVDVDPSDAAVVIYRPDGKAIPVNAAGRYFVENLSPGTYTIVFKDAAGHRTPAPQTRVLSPGGSLTFSAKYEDAAPGGGGGGTGAFGSGSSGVGTGSGVSGTGPGGGGSGSGPGRGGSGGGRGGGRGTGIGPGDGEGSLDRRVQMVVKSYPATDIEKDFDPIPYPEVVIRKSKFQQGWCQVYLIVFIDDRGEVERIDVERPMADERPKFESLIRAVEAAVRDWNYDRVNSEVHVDVRFYVE
jgi:hypothetical protein